MWHGAVPILGATGAYYMAPCACALPAPRSTKGIVCVGVPTACVRVAAQGEFKCKQKRSGPWRSMRVPEVAVGGHKGYSLGHDIIHIPFTDQKASTVVCVLYECFVAYFGIPHSILADRGTEFISSIWKQLKTILGCLLSITSLYCPQGNSVVERSHPIP